MGLLYGKFCQNYSLESQNAIPRLRENSLWIKIPSWLCGKVNSTTTKKRVWGGKEQCAIKSAHWGEEGSNQ